VFKQSKENKTSLSYCGSWKHWV